MCHVIGSQDINMANDLQSRIDQIKKMIKGKSPQERKQILDEELKKLDEHKKELRYKLREMDKKKPLDKYERIAEADTEDGVADKVLKNKKAQVSDYEEEDV